MNKKQSWTLILTCLMSVLNTIMQFLGQVMDNVQRRIAFVLEDIRQLLFQDPGLDRSTYLSMLDAYRSLICLYDNLKRKDK